jgi:uncharacterized membrane protein
MVFAIGGIIEALGTDIDVVLGVYAVLFVLALPFLRWPPRRLLLAAGVLAVVSPPVDLLLAQWAEAADSHDVPFVWLTVTEAYPGLIWWTFILVGLAVGRCDLTSARVRTTLVVTGAGRPSSATPAVRSPRSGGRAERRWTETASPSARPSGTWSG